MLAGVRAPELFDAVAREAAARAEELSAQALANLAWAFATTRHPAPGLYVALADQAERRVQALGAQNLGRLRGRSARLGELDLILDCTRRSEGKCAQDCGTPGLGGILLLKLLRLCS